jgi:hypothetical protein
MPWLEPTTHVAMKGVLAEVTNPHQSYRINSIAIKNSFDYGQISQWLCEKYAAAFKLC